MMQSFDRSELRYFIALSVVAVLAGCATGGDCQAPVGDTQLTPTIAAASEESVGRYQTWGGLLVEARNLEESTELEIVGYPLNRCGRPDTGAGPVGRFILVQQGYLETADLKPGRKVTATGRISGIRKGRVGETDYRFPILDGGALRLWSQDSVDQADRRPRFSIGVGGGSGWSSGGVGVWF